MSWSVVQEKKMGITGKVKESIMKIQVINIYILIPIIIKPVLTLF